jgi:hypothetical protein
MAADNSHVPNTRVIEVQYEQLVLEVDPHLRDPHRSYEFSKRIFHETDSDGIYGDGEN